MAAWHAQGSVLGVSVNVSGRQLDHDVIVDAVRRALELSGLDPAMLTIEVTETALTRSIANTARRLSELKALGVQLAPGEGHPGVAIVGVDPEGLAASKGLSNGDFILEVSGKPVTQPNEVKALIATAKQEGKKSVLMLIRTSDASRFVAFEFPKV